MGPNEKAGEDCVYGYLDIFRQVGEKRTAEVYLINKRRVTVGREHRCDIRLLSLRVSRLQCCIKIVMNEGELPKVFLLNLSANATTKYRGKILKQNEQVELFGGDRFILHDAQVRYRVFVPSCRNAKTDPGSNLRIPMVLRACDEADVPELISDDESLKIDEPKSDENQNGEDDAGVEGATA